VGEAEGGVLPELTDLVGDGPFEKDGSGWDTVVTGGTRLGDALRSSWERLQGHAKVNTTDDHEGLLVACGASHNRGSGQAAAERADQGGGAGEARRAGGGAGEAAPARSA
jgi:hypothetical protein